MNASHTIGRAAIAWIAAAALAAAAPVFAGEPAKEAGADKVVKKCSYTTQECLNAMAGRMKASGWIGIYFDPEKNMEITRVVEGSPAEKAGLQVGDLLFALNGIELRSENDDAIMKARKQWAPGQVVRYTVKRAGVAKQVDITLGEWPADLLARYIGEHMLEHAEADALAAAPKK